MAAEDDIAAVEQRKKRSRLQKSQADGGDRNGCLEASPLREVRTEIGQDAALVAIPTLFDSTEEMPVPSD
ncbi:hypothetical protein NDU88_004070 [Pleurodeles waltl]|uniref:Uncharacterized protein n=1 Tax=Pleurodeles waltl TaxID=8319 RepID=A0AAV7UED7_PLEWA|nr:hypothetical protein NDU88_004070 [Pleurodeles waltl]